MSEVERDTKIQTHRWMRRKYGREKNKRERGGEPKRRGGWVGGTRIGVGVMDEKGGGGARGDRGADWYGGYGKIEGEGEGK